jgi:predicted nucleic acid-binding protein
VNAYLVDTNILVRLFVGRDPLSPAANAAISELRRQRASVSVAHQSLVEFWAVSTRPVDANGLGLPTEDAAEELDRLQGTFRVLDDPAGTFWRWRQLVQAHGVRGRQAYDARLAAIMIESGIDHILTFNVDDFRRYPGITVVSPHSLSPPRTPPAQGSKTE